MIQFRAATVKDLENIALLHAQSWQLHYRESFSAAYLDGPVFEERLEVWKARFEQPNPKQQIILAEGNQQLCGFVCVYLDHHPEWGALIDNLHVLPSFQGQGLGKKLMEQADLIITDHHHSSRYFLYVLTANKSAIGFYQHIGGKLEGSEMFETPTGKKVSVYRILWE